MLTLFIGCVCSAEDHLLPALPAFLEDSSTLADFEALRKLRRPVEPGEQYLTGALYAKGGRVRCLSLEAGQTRCGLRYSGAGVNNEDLTTYLNDHLAGSVAALEMLDDVIQSQEGKPLETFLEDLRKDIQSDQEELKGLMKRLDMEQSTLRKAGAWMVEKLLRTKLHRSDDGEPNLALFQSLEALALGITGKLLLWRTLAGVVLNSRQFQGIDFACLEARAADQIERVEAHGLEIGRQIFGPGRNAADS